MRLVLQLWEPECACSSQVDSFRSKISVLISLFEIWPTTALRQSIYRASGITVLFSRLIAA